MSLIPEGGTLVTFFQQGGPFMYLILLAGAVATAVSIERFVVLFLRNRLAHRPFVDKVCNLVSSGSVEQAASLVKSKNTALTRIVGAALGAADRGGRDIQNAVDEVALAEIPDLQDRIAYLATVAQIATLLGLLGTILGLIGSFSAVGSAASEQRAMLLAAGISTALNTTAMGLIVAAPTTFLYTLFQRKSERVIDSIDEASVRVMNTLAAREYSPEAIRESAPVA